MKLHGDESQFDATENYSIQCNEPETRVVGLMANFKLNEKAPSNRITKLHYISGNSLKVPWSEIPFVLSEEWDLTVLNGWNSFDL